MFDLGVWHHVKNLKIFDDDDEREKPKEMSVIEKNGKYKVKE